jgi:hypothetical protein
MVGHPYQSRYVRVARHSTNVRFSELLLLPIVFLAQGVRLRWLASSDALGGTEVPAHNNPAEGEVGTPRPAR